MSLQRISFVREVLQGLCLVLLIVIPSLLYARTLAFDFVNWDDDLYVYANAAIRGFSWEHVSAWFTRPYVSLYVPVPMATYALNYAAGGLEPGSFHAWNAVIHVANAVLVFFLFFYFRRDLYLCFLAALIFAVHPIQVESAAWVSQRKTLLFAFFTLSGFLAFVLGYFAREKRRRLFVLASVCFLLALLSKATAVMIPAVLLAFHYFYREEPGASRRFVLPYLLALPFFVMALVTLSFYPRALSTLMSGELFSRVIPWGGATAFYLGLILNPSALDIRYPEQLMPPVPDAAFWVGTGMFFGLALLALLTLRRAKPAFWIFWFLLFLMPASQIVAAPAGDRHVYLSLAGLLGLVLAVPPRLRALTLAVLGVWAVVLIPAMSARLEIWQNSETLWKSLRLQGPHQITADVQLAAYYEEQGRFTEAADVYGRMLARRPHLPYPYINAYNLFTRLGRAEKAAEVASLFQAQYSQAHPLGEVYQRLLALKKQPSEVRRYLDEVMRSSLFGLPGERKMP